MERVCAVEIPFGDVFGEGEGDNDGEGTGEGEGSVVGERTGDGSTAEVGGCVAADVVGACRLRP